ncbi:hypothetical protein HOU02_gp456 [Caulobacter phage CcrBL9]|uniref:Uncharacterized protein n=1 Tax=Caulobacter phage CcrBL9 TaxID=2283270 RepID=A0A385EF00_9CAUD|nr:hypothetical protein HOU02_gp456 [Caulobacter phage CcrBL9]AXQ69269.1 hypothetical protein CcrBL9_gp245c [Caulobacter phage CcrBL9]
MTQSAEQIVELFLREGQAARQTGVDDKGRPVSAVQYPCGRCGGAGRSEQWAMTGYTCYQCGGHGRGKTRHERLYTAEELAKLNDVRDRQRAKKRGAYEAAQAARLEAEEKAKEARKDKLAADPFYQSFSALYGRKAVSEDERDHPGEFLTSMWRLIQHQDLTEAQVAAVQKFIDRDNEQRARLAHARHVGVVGERMEFAGVVADTRCLREATSWMSGRYLIKIRIVDGQMLTYFGSRYIRQGTEVAGKAMVSAHETYKGEPQTVIKNPRFSKGANDDD